MLSLQSRRDPVHQAALAFFLVAGLSMAAFALAPSTHPSWLGFAALLSLAGVFGWRRSLAALVIGTAFFTLVFVRSFVASLAYHKPLGFVLANVAVHGALLFVMVRGLLSLRRAR